MARLSELFMESGNSGKAENFSAEGGSRPIEKKLLEKFPADVLEQKIDAKISEFQGLLNRDVAIKIIAKEEGLLQQEERDYLIKDIFTQARRIRLSAKIAGVFSIKEYSSGNRSRTVLLQDDTGAMPLTLWNDQIAAVAGIKSGDTVAISGAYEKNGDLLLQHTGSISLSKQSPFDSLGSLVAGSTVTVKVAVSSLEGRRDYSRNGQRKSFFSFRISDGTTEARCLLWDGIERVEGLAVGDEMVLENAYVKNGELHAGANTRILVKKSGVLRGKITFLDVEHGQLKVVLDSGSALLGRDKALKLLDAALPDDVSLETIVKLKKDSLINKRIAIN